MPTFALTATFVTVGSKQPETCAAGKRIASYRQLTYSRTPSQNGQYYALNGCFIVALWRKRISRLRRVWPATLSIKKRLSGRFFIDLPIPPLQTSG
jgi:hypothetical protein